MQWSAALPLDAERFRDLYIERAVLGAVLLSPATASVYRKAGVTAELFSHDAHIKTWRAIETLLDEAALPDYPLLARRLEDLGTLEDVTRSYLAQILDDGLRLTPANIDAYVAELSKLARCRRAVYGMDVLLKTLAEDPQAINEGCLEAFVASVDRANSKSSSAGPGRSESLPDLLTRIATLPVRDMVVGDLLARGEISMLHGDPRVGKSWVVDYLAVCVACGVTPFNLERFTVPRAQPVLLVGNEDRDITVGDRCRQILRGLDITDAPENLHFYVGKGLSLDDPEWQARLTEEVRRLDIGLVIFDPVRSVTKGGDQGPPEWRPVAMFLRYLIGTTRVAVLLSHHDTKPRLGMAENRPRPHRASGGGVFASVDAPIHAVKLDDCRTHLVPDSFKHAADPDDFVVVREHDGEGAARFRVETGRIPQASVPSLDNLILEFLKANPSATSKAVTEGVKKRKQDVLDRLGDLLGRGLVDVLPDGPAQRWTVRPSSESTS
jgi:hypothetical protein